jgi:predicted nucleotidyltransferase
MEIPGYKGNLPWLPSRTIFLTRHGSHAYGTNTPTSDLDLKGVAIPPREYFLGFAQHFEQAEVREPDMVVYELRKFMQLAADCNPNIIETLFTDPSDHLGVTPLGEKLLAARDLFLSRRARYTFSGYAMAQMRRLETHYRWVKSPPPVPPRREDFGLAALSEDEEARLKALHGEIDRLVKTWDTDLSALPKDTQDELRERITEALAERVAAESESWRAASRHLGLNDETIQTLAREREFRARLREWEQFASWLKSRNPKRAELEAKYGYDTKFGAHVVRLFRMCREILETGRVQVRRPDRDELLAIRNGAWSFDALRAFADAEDKATEGLYKASKLPHSPDRKALDALCVSMVDEALRTMS